MLREKITGALKDAMKAKDEIAVSSLRLIQAALKDRDIAARSQGNPSGISDDEILGLLQSMIKQRRDSIEMYDKGGRQDLVEREAAEIGVIERFLPAQMGAEEIDGAVRATIEEIGAEGLKDMGRVMAALKERYAGQMDFAKASAKVKAHLVG